MQMMDGLTVCLLSLCNFSAYEVNAANRADRTDYADQLLIYQVLMY